MQVVASDYHEELGLRDVLNFGHTWGHVMESLSAKGLTPLSHGRAVAYGMAVALLYSERHYHLNKNFARTSRSICLSLAGGEFPAFPDPEEVKELLSKDKKIRDGKLKYVILPKPHSTQVVEIDAESLIDCARLLNTEIERKDLSPYQ
jgi:3-dehydroquinate synthase